MLYFEMNVVAEVLTVASAVPVEAGIARNGLTLDHFSSSSSSSSMYIFSKALVL